MRKKRLFINLISNIISFILQIGISFLLTPIIVEKVGDAAYGFIGLANNFVSYATLFTIVINSMASRFITLELSKNNLKEANKYYSSVFIMNIIMSSMVAIASIVIICNLNLIIEIPSNIQWDVYITFSLAFINLIISLLGTIFSVATYAKDRLDMSAIRTIIGNILKALFLIIAFSFFVPKIYYICIGALIVTIYSMITNIRITKKIAPELKIDSKLYDRKSVITLAKAGVWNLLSNLSRILLTGLDLLIANIFIGPDAMGILSIAKTIPNNIESLLGTISTTFGPQFIMLYSQNKIKDLVKSIKFAIKMFGIIMIVPIVGILVYGGEFFTLWLPSKTPNEIMQIQILSILSMITYIANANGYIFFLIDTVTNKLKRPVLVTLFMSIASTITTLVLLKTTSLGIYAVAGVSSIYWALKVFFFNTINAAKNLRIKWYTFFGQFIKNIICLLINIVVFIILKNYLLFDTWLHFAISILIVGCIGYALNFLILLNKDDKNALLLYGKKIISKFSIKN